MKTPKKVLTAIKKHDRRVKKTLTLARDGKRLRGDSQWASFRDVADFVRISRLLEQNRVKTALDVYVSMVDLGTLPVILVNYLDRQFSQLTS